METMASWFGLTDTHSDFTVQSDVDAKLLFARSEINEKLDRILRRSFRTDTPPKLVLWGDFGVGKTHTMRHVEYEVETNPEFSGRVVFVDLPDITSKSTYQTAHAAFLDALGLDTVRQWMNLYQAKTGGGAYALIQEVTQSADIAVAFTTLVSYGDTSRDAWDWLRGLQLSAADARNVGLPPVLSQSQSMVHVERMLGKLSQENDGKMLIFMLDEAEQLTGVKQDATAHWMSALRALVGDPPVKEVGLIVAASFRDVDEMPAPLRDPQVRSRFGESHYIQLRNFEETETRVFLHALLEEWADPAKRDDIIASHEAEADGEPVLAKTFPFTEPAFQRFVEYTIRDGYVTRPRDIQKDLDDFVNMAMDDQRHILSLAYIDNIINSGL